MLENYEKVKNYLFELGFSLAKEDEENQLVVINDESRGILNMVIDCEEPIVILEQYLFDLKSDDPEIMKTLLQWNRTLVHGAFVLDESGTKVIFRDTLQLKNLDLNELEASILALSLAMGEHSAKILEFAKI